MDRILNLQRITERESAQHATKINYNEKGILLGRKFLRDGDLAVLLEPTIGDVNATTIGDKLASLRLGGWWSELQPCSVGKK